MKLTKTTALLLTGGILLSATACSVTRDSEAAGSAFSARTSCDVDGNSQGVSDSTIALGMFTPMTGPASTAGLGALEGFEYAIEKVNAEGGVQGRTIELAVEDDQYDAAVAQKAIRRLETDKKVFAVAGGVGTPNFVAVLPYIKENGIPAVGPYAPSNQVGVIENPDVYMIWPNYIDEFEAALSWLMKEEPAASVSFVQQVGDVGDDALTGIERALEGTGVELATIETVEATTTDFTAIAQSLKNAGSELVVFISGPVVVGQAIKAMHQLGYEPRTLGPSDLTDETFAAEFPEESDGMIVATRTTPNTSSDPLVQEFVTGFTEATGSAPTMWNAVGYTQAMITIEALENAEALTRDCFEYALDQMEEFETGFIPPVTFGPENRQGVNAVGVGKITKDGIVEVAPFQVLAD